MPPADTMLLVPLRSAGRDQRYLSRLQVVKQVRGGRCFWVACVYRL
jgi:hypothetical protein